ncbi:MAG TPA: hemerythrin domain-containing protein [Phycisphaerales bacterium]|nr:hemerythrin domain-containing protein [Phycisphaerales bacterium]
MLHILGHTPDHGFDEPLGLLSDCHRRIERFLGVMLRVAGDHAHGALPPDAAEAVTKARRYFAHAAPKHTADEEESLFPRMRAAAAAKGRSCEVVERLEDDHERATPLHERVDALFDEWLRAGSLARERQAELETLLGSLRDIYRAHIHTEDSEVFPLAGTLLSDQELAAVGSEMRARRGLSGPA